MSRSPNWSSIEIVTLTEMYPKYGLCPELLTMLAGRTAKAINVKASRLGLKVTEPWNKKLTQQEYIAKLTLINPNVTPVDELCK